MNSINIDKLYLCCYQNIPSEFWMWRQTRNWNVGKGLKTLVDRLLLKKYVRDKSLGCHDSRWNILEASSNVDADIRLTWPCVWSSRCVRFVPSFVRPSNPHHHPITWSSPHFAIYGISPSTKTAFICIWKKNETVRSLKGQTTVFFCHHLARRYLCVLLSKSIVDSF